MKTKNAKCLWTRGFQFVGSSDSGHAVVMDTSFGEGEDSAITPVELILMGLMGCTGMDVVSILKRMRKELTYLEISCEAEWAEASPKYFDNIHLYFRVVGNELDSASVERAIKLSSEKYCSVSEMLSGKSKITHDLELLETAPRG